MTKTSETTEQAEAYTDAEATDEAVLLLTRKLMRLHAKAYADVIAKLPDGAREALGLAEARADKLRDAGPRRYLTFEERYGETTED